MKIGERIKALRTSKGMTQTELAEMLQTTKQNVFKYENGIVTNIPSDRIEKMAEIFDVKPGELMGWSENASKTLKFKSDATNTIKLTDREISVALAYRNHPAEQTAVDRILEIDWNEYETVRVASRSADDDPITDIKVPKSKIKAALADKSIKTDDDL